MLLALALVTMLEFADRALLGVLVEPVKTEFGLSDTQMGFLLGFSFVLLRVIVGLPMARLADAWNRRNVLLISLGFWSLMTAMTGYARNFVELSLARVGVGAGVAGSSPSALSMIADLFPLGRRGAAMAIWIVGGILGFSLGYGAGALIAKHNQTQSPAVCSWYQHG